MEQNTSVVVTYFRSGAQDEFGFWNDSIDAYYDQFIGMYSET